MVFIHIDSVISTLALNTCSLDPSLPLAAGVSPPKAPTALPFIFYSPGPCQMFARLHRLFVQCKDPGGLCAGPMTVIDKKRCFDNIAKRPILLLPPYSPELNPAELIWRQLRQRKLSNRLYPTIDDLEIAIDEACLWISNQQDELSNLCLFPRIKSALTNWN